MTIIKCALVRCLHNYKKFCNVDGQIDINRNGECVDYSPLTDEEYEEITGMDRTRWMCIGANNEI